jgi:hypothetical protein
MKKLMILLVVGLTIMPACQKQSVISPDSRTEPEVRQTHNSGFLFGIAVGVGCSIVIYKLVISQLGEEGGGKVKPEPEPEPEPKPKEEEKNYDLSFKISSYNRDFFVMFNFFHITHPFRLFLTESNYDLTTIWRDDNYDYPEKIEIRGNVNHLRPEKE